MTRQGQDITVIGAGAVGLCSALYLQEKGYRVHILDREAPADGCSFGNAGILARSSCAPIALPDLWRQIPGWLADPQGPMSIIWSQLPGLTPWLWKFFRSGRPQRLHRIAQAMLAVNSPSVDLYRQLLAGRGHENLIQDASYIHLYRTADEIDLNELEWQLKIQRGAEIVQLNRQELLELEPEIAPAYQAAVEIRHQGKTVNPGRLGKTLAERVLDQGGRISRGEVYKLYSAADGSTHMETSLGPIRAEQLVICAGSWSGELARQLGARIPLIPDRGYHLTIENPGVRINNTLTVAEYKFALNSMEMGLRCAGTSELGGLHTPPNYRRAKMLGKLAKQVLPGLKVGRSSEWMGHRPAVPDSVPVISALPGYEQVYIACGHGHLGLTGAPMTGRIMASLVSREPLNIDMGAYRADRF